MDERKSPAYRVLSTRTIVWAAIGLIGVGAGVAIWLLAAYGGGTDADRVKLDVIKTAGTIVVGTGGAAALWLAARRQQTSEIALRQKEVDQAHQERVAILSEHDAAERRVTDLYTKAVEQLGSDKAPVRLGGMYALERLAQNVPDQRQTIVNVLCAYLRMPYPAEPDDTTEQGHAQERQARLTAQRILVGHLHPGSDPDRPLTTFWGDTDAGLDIDLSGATLIDFDLGSCRARTARFDKATFVGKTEFSHTTFSGNAWFSEATFSGEVTFYRAAFGEDAWFGDATFRGNAWFSNTMFNGDAEFGRTTFHETAAFDDATFRGNQDNPFSSGADFSDATFKGRTQFNDTAFSAQASFFKATFNQLVHFREATFSGTARFDHATFGGHVSFDNASFNTRPFIDGGRVRLDPAVQELQIWPLGVAVTDSPSEDSALLPKLDGAWGHLKQA